VANDWTLVLAKLAAVLVAVLAVRCLMAGNENGLSVNLADATAVRRRLSLEPKIRPCSQVNTGG
jgi:hypothetical protein